MFYPNPSPDFLYARIHNVLLLNGITPVDHQALFSEDWMFFLSDFDRVETGKLELKERRLAESCRDGTNVLSRQRS